MDVLQTVREGVTGLSGHKLRAGLAVLGISIGVAAVIAMVALGEGAKARSRAEFEKLGANLIMVSPQTPDKAGMQEGDGRVRPLTVEEGERVFQVASGLDAWSAEVRDTSALAVRGKNASDTEIHGVQPSFAGLRNFRATAGRLLSDADLDETARVCVLGSEIAEELFEAGQDPLGQEVVLDMANDTSAQSGAPGAGGLRCRVIGVLASKGQAGWINFDRYVLMPLTTAQRYFRGDLAVDQLLFKARAEDPDDAAFEVETLLDRRHGGTPDFRVRLQSESREAKEETLRIFQYFISGIAGISLLVGGIGITNIMLISVLERTREIGVRMAIGAKRHHILGQFLTEAVTIGAFGGIGGLILGPSLGHAIAGILTAAFESGQPWMSQASALSAVIALSFSFLVGVLSGIYPALKASRMDPVEALRYE